MDITLLINYFTHSNSIRNDEFLFCLKKNIDNPIITKIIVFVDELEKYQFIHSINKCQLVEFKERMNYSDFFKYANNNLKDIIIVSNLDIYFDDTLKACNDIDFNKTVLALSRTDLISSCSQDVWIFKTPLNLKDVECDFSLGNPGCDNRIVYELHKNYEVQNLYQTIKCYHKHDSQDRTTNRITIPPPYYFPPL